MYPTHSDLQALAHKSLNLFCFLQSGHLTSKVTLENTELSSVSVLKRLCVTEPP